MKRIVALADRSAMPLLRAIAAINLLFLLAFLVSMAFTVGRARAEMPVCSGENLLQTLGSEDPAKLDAVVAEAAKTENGDGLLWTVEKEGSAPSYLFGTMHMTDPRVTALPAPAQTAFEASSTVVIETLDVLDEAKMAAALMSKPELMMFTDSTTLTSLLAPDEAAAVDSALDARGIPPFSVSKMKPWVISAMVALPACELARKAAGAPVLDVKLATDASAAGKAVRGLETAVEQLEAMASIPMRLH